MKKIMVLFGVIAAALVLYACGGSGSNSSTAGGSGATPAGSSTTAAGSGATPSGSGSTAAGSGATPTVPAPVITAPTAISTKDAAARAVNASKTLASSFATSSSFQSLSNLLKPALNRPADGGQILSTVRELQQLVAGVVDNQNSLGKRVAAVPSSSSCPDGGSISTSINPIVMTFTACKMGNEYKNGIITMTKPMWEMTSGADVALTVDMTTIAYAPGGYATKEHESVLKLTMKIVSFDRSAKSEILALNGFGREINYLSGTSSKLSLGDPGGDFRLNRSESTSGTVTTTTMIMDGPVSMDRFKDATFTVVDSVSGMTFQNLRVASDVNSLSIVGTYSIKTVPACLDGTFEITTQSPITNTGGGQVTVNGIVMVFNPDGTVTATINNTSQTIAASYASVCSLSF